MSRSAAQRGSLALFAAAALLVTLFFPLLLIHQLGVGAAGSGAEAGGEVTVGLAVILRATARRLLRGASTSLLRTTAAAMGRASARAFVRRAIKLSSRMLFASVVKVSADAEASARSVHPRDGLALALGFLALSASFWGVIQVSAPEARTALAEFGTIAGPGFAALAGVPLLVYAALHLTLGRALGVRAHYRTELDGILLQAYFTGAGSFLPLTTDVEYLGSDDAKRRLAIGSILGLLAVHVALTLTGRAFAMPEVSFLGAMFLVYAFVYCFPIPPLEGHFIWRVSKLQWLGVTLPILVAFVAWLPAGFGEIL